MRTIRSSRAVMVGAVFAFGPIRAQDKGKTMPEELPADMTGVFFELRVGDLTAVIGDHHDHGSGKSGYTAVRHLSHKAFPYSCFRPRYAGLLHTRGNRKVDVLKISDREVVITPKGGKCGHWERFILTEPHYVDYEYNFYPTREVTWVTWCCYMNNLKDPGIYVLQDRKWVRHYSPVHSIDASLAPNTMAELPQFAKVPDSRYPSGYASFADTFAPIRFDADRSFYLGRFHDLAFMWMFSRGDDVLPFMSPTGGGGKNNPAWDARYWLRDCVPGRKVSLKMRQLLKPMVSRDDCIDEYLRWKQMLDGGELDALRYPLWDVRGPKAKTFYLEKPWDRPFEVQVFKTQLEPDSRGTVALLDPVGREVAREELDVNGDEHRTIRVPPDKQHGVYRLCIDADERSSWNIVTDLYRESIALDGPVKLHRRVSGRRFYFRVLEGTGKFEIRAEGGQGSLAVWSPTGEQTGSHALPTRRTVSCDASAKTGDGGLWSFSFTSDADVTVQLDSDAVTPALAAYPAGFTAMAEEGR